MMDILSLTGLVLSAHIVFHVLTAVVLSVTLVMNKIFSLDNVLRLSAQQPFAKALGNCSFLSKMEKPVMAVVVRNFAARVWLLVGLVSGNTEISGMVNALPFEDLKFSRPDVRQISLRQQVTVAFLMILSILIVTSET
jgi:glycerol-3-phosphate acyltransferase PlsY